MQCPNCHTKQSEADTYCSHCGADLISSGTSVVPVQTNLPALLYNSPLPRNVAASVGALAVGVGLELLRRNLLARLTTNHTVEHSLPALGGMKDILFPQQSKQTKLPKGYEVQETIVCVRRVIRRG